MPLKDHISCMLAEFQTYITLSTFFFQEPVLKMDKEDIGLI